ncbi:MAG: ShlB/FhaC/HecB family hemolysin secretion/activation protein [Pseudomonadota bacterium]
MLARSGGAVIALLSAVTLMGPAGAQDQTQAIDDLRANLEDQERGAPQTPSISVPQTSVAPPAGAESVILRLDDIQLVGRDGAPLIDDGRLPLAEARALYAGLVGQETTLAGVYAIAREIELTLKREGFVFTRVVLPRQDIDAEGATILIAVLTTRVEAVEIAEPQGDIGPVRALVEKLVAPLAGMDNPTVEDIERASLLVTDLPGVTRATFVPSPGSTPDAIKLTMNVERSPLNAVGILTHRDGPVIGPGIFGGIGYANTYTSFGASTEIAYFNSWSTGDFPDLEERNTASITQRVFLGTGTAISGSFTYARTRPGDVLDPLELKGKQIEGRLEIEHPVVRTRAFSLWLGAGFEAVEAELELDDAGTLSDDSVRAFSLLGRGAVRDPFGETFFEAGIKFGVEALGGSESGDPNLSNPLADSGFVAFRGEVTRAQPIQGNLSAQIRATGQFSPEPLLSSQTISFGGSRYLKGYEPSELSGDSGFAVYGELRWDDDAEIFANRVGWGVYGFADYGGVFQSDTPGSEYEDRASVGAGARLIIPNGPQLEIEVAQPVTEALTRTGEHDTRINGSLVWFF